MGVGTWLITEAEREADDWRLFGYCHLFKWEWGYLTLSDLQKIKLPFRLTIEWDLYIFEYATVKELADD